MTRLTEGPTKKHNSTIEAGNEENSKPMSSIPDHRLLPTVLRAGACGAHPTKEAWEREEGARRLETELETEAALSLYPPLLKAG